MTETPKKVSLHEYDPAWPETFRTLSERVATALGKLAIGIEHVGSTSVPGLAAKPLIDLDVVVEAENVPEAIRRLATLGYMHTGDQGIAGREAFRWPPGEDRHHLYVCVPDSEGVRDHILFRDYLRAHPVVAGEYADLKRSLAGKHGDDREAYQEGKRNFIDEITRRAEEADARRTQEVGLRRK